MVRKVFKKKKKSSKLDRFIKKYNIPRGHLSINRKSVTRALLVGIFFAFIPMPFQMLAVVFAGLFVTFNVPIALSMVWLSNPITMPFMYYMEYVTGSFLTREPLLKVELTLKWFENNLSNIFIPLYVGTFFYAIILSTSVYYIVNWLWVHSVKKEKKGKIK
jgi:hypothetical protein